MKSEAFLTTLQQLPVEKRRRIRQIRDHQAQLQSIAGLKLLKLGFKQLKIRNYQLQKLQFSISKITKPTARAAKSMFTHFSISHSHNCICCVISKNKQVGIDVEKDRPLTTNLISKYQLGLDKLSPIRAWTQKEAIFKVYGDKSLSSVKQIQLEGEQARFNNQRYYVNSFTLYKNYQMSVASLQPNTKIKIKRVYF